MRNDSCKGYMWTCTCTYENAQIKITILVWFYLCFYMNILAEKGQFCGALLCLQPRILEPKEIMQFILFKTLVLAYRRRVLSYPACMGQSGSHHVRLVERTEPGSLEWEHLPLAGLPWWTPSSQGFLSIYVVHPLTKCVLRHQFSNIKCREESRVSSIQQVECYNFMKEQRKQ